MGFQRLGCPNPRHPVIPELRLTVFDWYVFGVFGHAEPQFRWDWMSFGLPGQGLSLPGIMTPTRVSMEDSNQLVSWLITYLGDGINLLI